MLSTNYTARHRWVGIFLIIVLLLSLIPPIAVTAEENGFTFTVGNVIAETNEVINVPVTITNNPGIPEWAFDVVFDESKLELTDAQSVRDDIGVDLMSNLGGKRVFVDFYANSGSITVETFVINLEFTVKAISGIHTISLEHSAHSCYNPDWSLFDLSKVTTIVGSITVDGGTDPDPDPSGINVAAGYGGTVTAAADDQYTVSAVSDGYVIDEVWVDGEKLAAADVQGKTTFTTTTAPEKSIFATFAYTVNF
jgi:hypothetical protein